LTDNRDFKGEQPRIRLNTAWFDEEFVSSDQWESMHEWENIFGKHRHSNARWRVFDPENKRHQDVDMCERFRKVIKVPWKKFYWLCETCDHIVTTGNTLIPWKSNKSDGSDYDSQKRRIMQNLFQLR